MKSWIFRMSREAMVYGVGKILVAGLYLMLVPAYTRLLAPSEFGSAELLIQLQNLLAPLVILGTDAGLSYCFFQVEANVREQAKLVSSRLQVQLTSGAIVAALAMLVQPWLSQRFFQGQLDRGTLALVMLGLVMQLLMTAAVDVYRLLHKPVWSVGVNLLYLTIAGGVTVLSLWLFQLSIMSFFFGQICGGLIAVGVGWGSLRRFLCLGEWNRSQMVFLVRTGLPLIPGACAMYALTNGEKWLVSFYLGTGALGIYAVGYRLASVISLWVESFRQAFLPLAMQALKSAEGALLFRHLSVLYLTVSALLSMLVALFIPSLLTWLAGPKYHESYHLLGLLAWSFVFSGLYNVVTPGIWKERKVWLIPASAGIAVTVSLALSAYLIPRVGLFGAVASILIAYALWIAISLTFSERLWPVGYPIWRMLALVVAGLAGTVMTTLFFMHQASLNSLLLSLTASFLTLGLTSYRPIRAMTRD